MNDLSYITDAILDLFPLLKRKLIKYSENVAGGGIVVPAQVQVLLLLKKEGVQTVSDIGQKLNIAKSNMTPLITRLADANFVTRQHSNLDRRTVNISITPKGEEYLEKYIGRLTDDLADRLRTLNPDSLRELGNALNVVKNVLSDLED
ncbi:MAG TPA: MarR family transcriptional regulator [Clostridia bacterium]|nr:MarR family transcriptional regulator [Clostridia bacterium]